MKILISPAKKLNIDRQVSLLNDSECKFLNNSQEIMDKLSRYSVSKLQKLMNVSMKIAITNKSRNDNWKIPFTSGKQSIHLFQGEVYSSMKIDDFTREDMEFTSKHLRILSGLYGLLRPTDVILPYRLEMGTRIQIGEKKNLYEYWRDILTSYLIEEVKEDKFLVNLASDEYFKVIDRKKIPIPIITPIFKDIKNGKAKVISFFAKRARGELSNFIIKNKINSIKDIRKFNRNNYILSKSDSTDSKLVFIR